MAATQETKTPIMGIVAASPISSTSFTAENTVLPTGTHSALRSPVSTPSCRVSRFQAMTATTKTSAGAGPCRKRYEGPHTCSVSRKTPAASATTTQLPA